MSLMSIRENRIREKLNNAALEDGASKEDLLRAALTASNDRYEKAVQEQNDRLDRLESAVRASNEQKAIDIQGALKRASAAILEDVKKESAAYIKAMDEAAARLNAAHKKKDDNDKKEMAIFFAVAFGVVFAAFYLSLLCYGWWYDIPEAVDGITQHNTLLEAINNGIYQLLQR